MSITAQSAARPGGEQNGRSGEIGQEAPETSDPDIEFGEKTNGRQDRGRYGPTRLLTDLSEDKKSRSRQQNNAWCTEKLALADNPETKCPHHEGQDRAVAMESADDERKRSPPRCVERQQ